MKSVSICAAPQRASPSAAALTSVSKPTGTDSAFRTAPTRSKFCHPGLGVEVIWPNVGDNGCRSIGPNEPMPTACNLSPDRSRKKIDSLFCCSLWRGGRDLNDFQILWARADSTDEFGSTGLDGAEQVT